MAGWLVLAIATPILIAASLLGGLLPMIFKATHLRMQLALSFVSGLMLGVAVLHLLPHSIIMLDSVDKAAFLMLLGVVSVFLLMRFLHVHSVEPGIKPHSACDHEHEANQEGGAVRWMTLLAGLSLHSFVDGAALASAIKLEQGHALPGFLVLIVVVLHKPLDALAISATIGNNQDKRKKVNLLYSLIAPLAAWLVYLGFTGAGESGAQLAGIAMAFCAGAFVCVALADLLPEVQFHSHHRVPLTFVFLIGVAVAMLLGVVEGHNHGVAGHEGHDHSSHSDHTDHTGHNH
ncbi:MAG: ZIP family metal transporter [Phycisphaerales bacterium JB061]